MKLYFYTNKNLMFDFLGRNIIAPDLIVEDKKQYRTVGTALDHFLFVTHKKLARKSRVYGIAEPEFVYPVTLELSDITGEDGKAILVRKDGNEYSYCFEEFSKYDPEKDIGAFLIGEIPLSRVEKIYFDTQEDMDMFFRPSPDYWYPVNKYGILPLDFSEELEVDVQEERLHEVCGRSGEGILKAIRQREKKRAAVLNYVIGTQKWQQGRYIFNMDPGLQTLFGIKDEDLNRILPHYLEVKGENDTETLSLVGEREADKDDFNQKAYDYLCHILMAVPYNTNKLPNQIVKILDKFAEQITADCKSVQEKKLVRNTIAEIKKLISDESKKTPEEIMAGIPEGIGIMKALLFVFKNPNRYDLFFESLNSYHADMLTKRRALVLWGFLNGLYGIPGEGFQKDNQLLWQFIEAYVHVDQASLSIPIPAVTYADGSFWGISLKEERIITAEEIRNAILKFPEESLTAEFYKKLLNAAEVELGSRKKAENRGYAYHVASVDLPEIHRGDNLDKMQLETRKAIERLLKDFKSAVPDKEKLFHDYVENAEKFNFVFSLDQKFWTHLLGVKLEKPNA